MKTLLVVSGGVEAIAGIQRAKDMGLSVVVSDGSATAPGFALADDKLVVSTYDADATAAAAREFQRTHRRLDGVMCIASDVPVTVATVARELGLPGIPVPSAMLAMDKLAMKEKFAQDGVAIPWFSAVSSASHLKTLVREQGFPLVLKPVDSRGARGVLRLTADVDLEWAYGESRKHSPTDRVMLERFLPGPQISTESLVVDGVAYTPGFVDRNYEYLERYAPHIIENGGQFPSILDESTRQRVRDVVQQAADSFGIVNGIVKGDIVVTDGRAHVIEIAARLSGGYFCTHQIPLNSGVDLLGNAIRMTLGERVDPRELQPKYDRPVASRWFFPTPGVVTHVDDPAAFAKRTGIEYLELRVKPGDVVGPIDAHPARAGVVIASGGTRDEAVGRANDVIRSLRIETRPA